MHHKVPLELCLTIYTNGMIYSLKATLSKSLGPQKVGLISAHGLT